MIKIGQELFSNRGIVGYDYTDGCFVCGGKASLYRNISGFVESRESGKRIVSMFDGKGARLDYRENEPNWIQVKIGACSKHEANLMALHGLTKVGNITRGMISRAKSR